MFIPDPNIFPSRILDLGVQKAPDPESGSATLLSPFYNVSLFYSHNTVISFYFPLDNDTVFLLPFRFSIHCQIYLLSCHDS